MQQDFTCARLSDHVTHIDQIATHALDHEWVADDPRFQLHPAMKILALDIASVNLRGCEPGSDSRELTEGPSRLHRDDHRGEAIIRTSVPPFQVVARLVVESSRGLLHGLGAGAPLQAVWRRAIPWPTVLGRTCYGGVIAEDEDGNRFTDEDVVAHLIFFDDGSR